MIENKKEFTGGLVMMVAFTAVLVFMFTPVFKGQNGLEYMDSLYNSISKGSAYYVSAVKESAAEFAGNAIDVELAFAEEARAQQSVDLFMKAGALVNAEGKTLKVSGDLGKILENALEDSDAMYYNRDAELSGKYGYDGKRVLLNWWVALHHLEADLKHQKKYNEAKIVATTTKKAVECCYNYFGIEPQSIGDKIGVVIFSLVFYVLYTLWYGFAIMFMFEGWGMELGH
jgi:hypothetical protein